VRRLTASLVTGTIITLRRRVRTRVLAALASRGYRERHARAAHAHWRDVDRWPRRALRRKRAQRCPRRRPRPRASAQTSRHDARRHRCVGTHRWPRHRAPRPTPTTPARRRRTSSEALGGLRCDVGQRAHGRRSRPGYLSRARCQFAMSGASAMPEYVSSLRVRVSPLTKHDRAGFARGGLSFRVVAEAIIARAGGRQQERGARGESAARIASVARASSESSRPRRRASGSRSCSRSQSASSRVCTKCATAWR
jgi:hypothetical protein